MKRTISALVFFSLTLPAFGQGIDPLIGTWKLNLEKSTGAIGFRSLTLTWTGEGQNFIDTADGVTTQGQPFHAIFRHQQFSFWHFEALDGFWTGERADAIAAV
jgi:hypothetical protein